MLPAPLPRMIPVPPVEETGPSPIELRERQVNWAHTARDILLRAHGYLDTSKMGSGKTVVTLWVASQFNYRILVVGLPTLETMWRREAAKYGVDLIDFISFQSLRSKRGYQPQHGYLDRYDRTTRNGQRRVSFEPTQGYLDLLESGILLVVDEIDKIKNVSAQSKAVAAMTSPIITGGGVARFVFLSAIPFDKPCHTVQILKAMGYVRSKKLYTYSQRDGLRLRGLQELIDSCRYIDAEGTERVLQEIPLARENMSHICYALYRDVLMGNISGSMPPPDLDVAFDARNGFYHMQPANLAALRGGVRALMEAVGIDPDEANIMAGEPVIDSGNIELVTLALMAIERAKAPEMARVAIETLASVPGSKVIVSLNYNENIATVSRAIANAGYTMQILNGSIPAYRRQYIIDAFNDQDEQRALIMNTIVGGHGINLHDTTGNHPRYLFQSPDYKLLNIAQATGRIYRDGTLSDATVRMFYGAGPGAQELSVIDALSRKSEVARGTVTGPAQNALVLPGEYPEYHEE